jgi:hypothetical protein
MESGRRFQAKTVAVPTCRRGSPPRFGGLPSSLTLVQHADQIPVLLVTLTHNRILKAPGTKRYGRVS